MMMMVGCKFGKLVGRLVGYLVVDVCKIGRLVGWLLMMVGCKIGRLVWGGLAIKEARREMCSLSGHLTHHQSLIYFIFLSYLIYVYNVYFRYYEILCLPLCTWGPNKVEDG